MVKLLNNRPYFSWINYSVPETKAFGPMAKRKMEEELREQIRPVHCVIIIGGMWTNYRASLRHLVQAVGPLSPARFESLRLISRYLEIVHRNVRHDSSSSAWM
jgi:hypothetical protein